MFDFFLTHTTPSFARAPRSEKTDVESTHSSSGVSNSAASVAAIPPDALYAVSEKAAAARRVSPGLPSNDSGHCEPQLDESKVRNKGGGAGHPAAAIGDRAIKGSPREGRCIDNALKACSTE